MGTIPKRVKQFPYPDPELIKDKWVFDFLNRMSISLHEDAVLKLRDYSNLYDTIMESVLEAYIFEENDDGNLQPRVTGDVYHNDPYFEYNSDNNIRPKIHIYGGSIIIGAN